MRLGTLLSFSSLSLYLSLSISFSLSSFLSLTLSLSLSLSHICFSVFVFAYMQQFVIVDGLVQTSRPFVFSWKVFFFLKITKIVFQLFCEVKKSSLSLSADEVRKMNWNKFCFKLNDFEKIVKINSEQLLFRNCHETWNYYFYFQRVTLFWENVKQVSTGSVSIFSKVEPVRKVTSNTWLNRSMKP